MPDVVYQYGADIGQILAALNQIDKTNEKVYRKAEQAANKAIKGIVADHQRLLGITKQLDKSINDEAKAYDKLAREAKKAADAGQKVGTSAGASGFQIGAISGIVSSLTTAFIQLGQQAVGVLVDIGKQSIQTALEMDTLKARLRGIFDGSQEAADQAFGFIQAKSKELGFDLSELAGAFIPKTESLAQFERVAKIATALARSDPEQGAIGARIALIEALSGTFTSLQRRFEIGKADTARIKEAFDKEGIEGFLTTLETVLQEGGRSFDDFADTAATSFAKVQISGEQILGRVGAPIVASLEEAANKILEFINTNEDDLIVFADTVGRSIADVIDLISSIDLGQFDAQSLIDIADTIFRIINAVELAAGQFVGLISLLDSADSSGSNFTFVLTNIDDAIVSLAGILALVKAAFEAAAAGAAPFVAALKATAQFATGDFSSGIVSATEAYAGFGEGTLDLNAGQEAFNKSILESQAAFQEYHDAINGNTDAQDKLRDKLKETAAAGTAQADAMQKAAAAQRELDEATSAAEEAQAKVNEAFEEAEKDFQRKLEDIDIAAERKRLDIQIEFAQKREDAATDNLRKLADIQRKNVTERADAAKDLERKEQDIARKFAEERIDLEKDQRQKRVDVERDYRLKLQDIQRQFLLDADEAEQKRDAVAFLRAIKERDKQVQEAQITRQRDVDELKVNGELRKEELRAQQARELEEARIANERKIEDLRASLERAIEDQNIAYARQLADLAEGEARKNEEAARARERDIEDAKLAYDRKLADLRVALEKELALLAEFAARKAALEAQIEAATPRAPGTGARPSSRGAPPPAGSSRQGNINSERQRAGRSAGRRRQFGGLVNAGQSYPVGEAGPELFTPSANGRIVPNSALIMPSFTPKSTISNITNSQQQNVNLGVLDPASVGVLNEAKMRNIVLNILAGL